jgi:hypothetical protein
MASMTHKVIFHSDNFDVSFSVISRILLEILQPFDDFLVVEHLENLQGMALMKGQIFSRNGLPILTYMQQSFFELYDQPKREQSKI